VGKGTKSIPVHSITAVQPAGSVTNGFIQFTLGGSSERRSQFGKQTTDAVHDENSVIFKKKHKADFEKLRDAVQAAITNRHAAAPAPQPTSSVADELAKLVQLRDAGVLFRRVRGSEGTAAGLSPRQQESPQPIWFGRFLA
jgi:hypothetical protein